MNVHSADDGDDEKGFSRKTNVGQETVEGSNEDDDGNKNWNEECEEKTNVLLLGINECFLVRIRV